jgi:hypothetical protein
MHPLDSSWLKLHWAKRHLDFLYTDQRSFYGREDESSRSDANADGSAELRHKPFVPPSVGPWSMIVGDAVHNMRCSLDHIVYALAVKHLAAIGKSGRPKSGTGFPIFQNVDRREFNKKTAEIEPEARDVIESLQPYDRTNPLWMLSVLDNADKHEVIRIHSARISMTGVTLSGDQPVQIGLADGRVFASDPITGQPTKELQPKSTLSVSLLIKIRGLDEPVVDTVLLEIHDFIRDKVIPCFSRFFPEKQGMVVGPSQDQTGQSET